MAVIDNLSVRQPIVLTRGLLEPSITDVILAEDGSTVDLSGATVVFFMRPLMSRTPVIESAAASVIWPPDDDGHTVRYDPQQGDTDIEGPYMGWWGYELPVQTLAETPEFAIIITDQGPGFGTQTGVIVDGIAQWMPTTLRAMREADGFGDRFLQRLADHEKRVVMGVVVSADAEMDYDPALVDYLSKRTAVRLIPAARDYWGRQHRSISAQSPAEQASYPDMLANLDELRQQLCAELASDWRQLQLLVPGLPQLRVEPMPLSSAACQPVTSDPSLTPPAHTGGPWWSNFFWP